MTTAKTIWKYELRGPRTEIQMPKGSAVLCVQTQYNKPVLWAEVDPEAPPVKRRFLAVPTGGTLYGDERHYVGTFQIEGGQLVFHVYTDRVEYPLDDSQEHHAT